MTRIKIRIALLAVSTAALAVLTFTSHNDAAASNKPHSTYGGPETTASTAQSFSPTDKAKPPCGYTDGC